MLASLALAAVLSQTSGNPYLSQAKTFYSNLEFEKCGQRLDMAPQWKETSKKEQEEIELYAGLCQYGMGNRKDAEEHFALALQINPDAQLPPYTSPKIVDLFKSMQKKVVRAKPPPHEEKHDDTPKKTTLVPADPPKKDPAADAIVRAKDEDAELRRKAVPIGLGALAAVSGVTGAYFGATAKSLESEAHKATFASDTDVLNRQAVDSATAANVSFAIAIAAAAGAAISYALLPKEPEGTVNVVGREPPPPPPAPAAKEEKPAPKKHVEVTPPPSAEKEKKDPDEPDF